MKKLLLFTVLLITSCLYSQGGTLLEREIETVKYDIETITQPKSKYRLFQDVLTPKEGRWSIDFSKIDKNELKNKMEELEEIKSKWEKPNGDIEVLNTLVGKYKILITTACLNSHVYCEDDNFEDIIKLTNKIKEKAYFYWQQKYNVFKEVYEQ